MPKQPNQFDNVNLENKQLDNVNLEILKYLTDHSDEKVYAVDLNTQIREKTQFGERAIAIRISNLATWGYISKNYLDRKGSSPRLTLTEQGKEAVLEKIVVKKQSWETMSITMKRTKTSENNDKKRLQLLEDAQKALRNGDQNKYKELMIEHYSDLSDKKQLKLKFQRETMLDRKLFGFFETAAATAPKQTHTSMELTTNALKEQNQQAKQYAKNIITKVSNLSAFGRKQVIDNELKKPISEEDMKHFYPTSLK